MRHTVIGIFDTFSQAEGARTALVAAGFLHSAIELQANPKRDDAAEPVSAPDDPAHAEPGILANIERFFSMLFGGREPPPEVAHYSEAVRRGAVLVAVDTDTEAQADVARTTLTSQGAIDIDERAASWGTLGLSTSRSASDNRDHSILDELGLGRGSGVPGTGPVNAPAQDVSRARAYPRADVGDPALDPLADPLAPRDPATVAPRDTFTGNPADPLSRDPLMERDVPGTRAAAMPPDTFERSALSERDALAGRDPLAPLDEPPAPHMDVKPDTLVRDPLAGRDPVTGRDPLAERGRPAEDDPLAPHDPLPDMRTDSARGWRPVDPLASLADSEAASDASRVAASGSQPAGPQSIPDEYMEYEDDFRSDYQSNYSATGSPYEDYEGAYRYGATLGNDDRYRSRKWDEQMEYDLRREWQGRHPEGLDTWDRFKAAIRHGWDRVTGHHHV